MWHPQSDEAHGEQPPGKSWLVPWVYPVGFVIAGIALLIVLLAAGGSSSVSGVLVNRDGAWAVLNDEGHTNVGILEVETTADGIVVRYSGGRVLSFDVDADDALVRADIAVGASVGTDHAVLTLARDGEVLDPATVDEPGGAIFISGTFR